MHYVKIIATGVWNLPVGDRILMDNAAAAFYLNNLWGDELQPAELPLPNWDTPPANLLIIRAGGIGDIVFLTPVLRELTVRFPQMQISLSCQERYREVLQQPALASIQWVPYPLSTATIEGFEAVIPLDDVIEKDNVNDAVSIWTSAILGPTAVLEDPHPIYDPPAEVASYVRERYPRTVIPLESGQLAESRDEIRIGIQIHASQACRSYPLEKLAELMDLLLKHSPRVHLYLFGSPGGMTMPESHDRITFLPDAQPELSLTEAAALIATCDVFIGPDSGLTHLAGAMRVPGIALYGSFHWKQRTVVFPSLKSIQGHTCPQGPCHWHARSTKWPHGAPCVKAEVCISLRDIEPRRILSAVIKKLQSGRFVAFHESAVWKKASEIQNTDGIAPLIPPSERLEAS